jgi:hypothetical protein
MAQWISFVLTSRVFQILSQTSKLIRREELAEGMTRGFYETINSDQFFEA